MAIQFDTCSVFPRFQVELFYGISWSDNIQHVKVSFPSLFPEISYQED